MSTQGMTTAVSQDFGECRWCGAIHQGECPRVKAKEFHPDGSLKRVEFFGEATPSLLPPVLQPMPEEDDTQRKNALEALRLRRHYATSGLPEV